MSRCFPFPPPGYEKKPQSDHVDLLIKKQKEKKHKKEKRYKEKREGKERKDRDKDKDQSKDKHREKKDKKEKHRDKDKKKEQKRDKDEKKTSYERKDGENIEGRDDRKPEEDSHRTKDLKDATRLQGMGSSAQKETSTVNAIRHSITTPEKRMVTIRDEERGAVNQMVQRRFKGMGSSAQKERSMGNESLDSIAVPEQKRMVTIRDEQKGAVDQMVQRRSEGMGSSAEKEKTTGNETLHSITIPKQKSMVQDEERGTVNQMVPRRFEGVGSLAPKERSTGNESHHSVTVLEQKRMVTACAMEERGVDNEMAQNLVSAEQRRLDGKGRPMRKDANKKIEGKKKVKEQEIEGTKRDKHKDKNHDKKHKGKDKIRSKEVQKEDKTREKEQHKHKEQDKLRGDGTKEQLPPQSAPKNNVKNVGTDGCLKRKQSNGFLHENELRPSKLPRPSSSQISLENGSQLDQRHTGNLCASDSHDAVKLEKILDRKEHKINGVIDVHPPSTMLRSPPIAEATENGETSKKLPHPDEKYLSRILQVPKIEEWPEFDDQEWLLNRDDLRQKPKKAKLEADEAPTVWAEPVRIDSADVLALPYVIPY